MRVDIKPQWKKLANWYWESLEGKEVFDRGMSIWEMLEQNYGAQKGFNLGSMGAETKMWVTFPDEKSYTAFLLRWS